MKKILFLIAALIVAFFTWNCEKDDICDANTATTPRLIMQFYNIDNPEQPKNVTSLLVIGQGSELPLATFNNVSKIELPLNTTQDLTTYRFTINSNNTAFDNEDLITFNYSRDDIFVSRACGYKTVFLLDAASPFVQTDGADLRWMQFVTVQQPDIQNENEVHISVLF